MARRIYTVSSEAEQLNLNNAEVGDLCIRNDISKTFTLKIADASDISHWSEIQYIIPNRPEPLTIIASNPITQNWNLVENAINDNYDLANSAAIDVSTKADAALIGAENGIATLDEEKKLTLDQLPEQAIVKIYSVDTVAQQLGLNANPGDICVRGDGKTFALAQEGAAQLQNWIEIATANTGGEIGSNPCYTNLIKQQDWTQDNSSLDYYITYTEEEHGQGNTQFLLVLPTRTITNGDNSLLRDINCHYTIDSNGSVTLYSTVPFDGAITISNLAGNVKNSQYIPYTIMNGPKINGQPSILTHGATTLYLNYELIVLIDGLNYVRNATPGITSLSVTSYPDGAYIIFIDSSDIVNNELTSIKIINSNNYLGVVEELPQGSEGQRCYVAYDKSYEYHNDSWGAKAFTPLGEMTIENGLITFTGNYPYRNNGLNVTRESTYYDHLFGPKIKGLTTSITSTVNIDAGKGLGQTKVLTLAQNMRKLPNQIWAEGNNRGCLDNDSMFTIQTAYQVSKGDEVYYTAEEDSGIYLDEDNNSYVEVGSTIYTDSNLTNIYKEAEEYEFQYTGYSIDNSIPVYGWGFIYLIGSLNTTDIYLSYDAVPTLPSGYTEFCLIGYFYRDASGVMQQIDYGNKTYFNTPKEIDNLSLDTILSPVNTSALLNIELAIEDNVKIYYNSILINSFYGKNITIEVPNTNINIITDNDPDMILQVLGYRNEEFK